MSTNCTRCGGTGFLNIEQVPEKVVSEFFGTMDHNIILCWASGADAHDVQVCDCCGNGEDWYGVPGEHYNNEDPQGYNGPYGYNDGLCECH